jgi:hypothetical protein
MKLINIIVRVMFSNIVRYTVYYTVQSYNLLDVYYTYETLVRRQVDCDGHLGYTVLLEFLDVRD